MQSTGQTSRHCGTSKWPTHSVHFDGIDHVDLGPLRDRLVRALGLADVAVDAFVGDHQRHGVSPCARDARADAVATSGCTKCETSPPNLAISRTMVAETNVNCSDGREEQRFDIRVQVPVHARHLELVLEVRHRAQAAQDDLARPARARSPSGAPRSPAPRRSRRAPARRAPWRCARTPGKNGFLASLSATPTTTRSNTRAARRTRSSCPRVSGSNVPG